MTKIKICGLRREQDIGYVNRYLPDYVGFIFVERRRRYISFDDAERLKQKLAPQIQAVGVFLDEEVSRVTECVRRGIIDVIQLHGREDDKYIEEVRKQNPGRTIVKAISVANRADVEQAMSSSADYLLFDTDTGKNSGGSGRAFDWNLLAGVRRPFFLAGGLTPDTVLSAQSMVHPFALDISSGVETDGWKDEVKIAAVINAIRGKEGK